MIYTPVIRTFIITRITHSVSNILRLLYTCFTFYSNERFRTIYAAFLTAVCVYTPVLYENKKQEKLAFCLFETFARYSDSARSVNSSILARYYRDKIFRYSLSFFFLFSFLSRRSSFIAIRSTPAVSNIFHDPPPFVQFGSQEPFARQANNRKESILHSISTRDEKPISSCIGPSFH